MLTYILKRIRDLALILLGVSIICFSIIHWIPGDPARIIAGYDATPEAIENVRRRLGLDKPVVIQYFTWLSSALRGDLGRSIATHRPVFQDLIVPIKYTFILSGAAIIIAIAIGIPAGVVSAAKRNTLTDYISMLAALFGISMPTFWLGLMLMLVFAVTLRWLPATGSGTVQHLILPAFSLGAYSAAFIARMTRSSMLDSLGQDYVRTAWAKGCSRPRVLYKHALKNSLIPVVTVTGLELGSMFAGAVVTETIFAWPGIGRTLILAISLRDYPMIQGAVLFVTISLVLVNLVTDILYAFLDPRIRYK